MTDMQEIQRYPLPSGYYSLGYFQHRYPEIDWIICLENINNETQIANLKSKISKSLKNNKKVALVIWDEIIIFPVSAIMTNFLNSYSDKPVWLITQLDPMCQLMYTFQHGLTCKIIELPWLWLNDTLVYYQVHNAVQPTNTTGSTSYICMVGNIIARHKLDLVRELQKQNLDQYGLITVLTPLEEFKNNKYIQVNPVPPYKNLKTKYSKMAAQVCCKTILTQEDIWISGNVENFLHIEKTYSDIPLVIQPESSVGIFQNSEKSLWPLLLGKMTLIYSRPGQVKNMQRFYDFDISNYANLAFDVCDGYDDQANNLRLQMMLSDNKDLIKNSRDIYSQFCVDLEKARWSIGQNLLDFCHAQIEVILNKEKQINDLNS